MKTIPLRIVGAKLNLLGPRSTRMLWTMIGVLVVATALSLTAQPGGLVGHWNFDEGSGLVAADSSGYGNNGQLADGTVWLQDQARPPFVLSFDGVNDHVNVGNSPSLNPSDQITLVSWVAPYDLSASGEIIAKSNGTDPQYYLRVQAGGKIRFGIGSTVLNGNTTLSPSQWHLVAGTYDGSTMKIYVNGAPDAAMSRNGPMHDNGVDVWIGCRRFRTLLAFNGLIDDPQIYNRALSANEIQSLATPGQVVITSINNQTFLSGSLFGWVSLDLTADVFNFAAPVAKVDYYEGPTLIGTATQAPYDVGLYYLIQTLGGTTHYIDAVATDTLGNVVRTAPFAFWYNICDFFVYNLDLLPFICRINSPARSVFAYGDPIPIPVSIIQPCDGMFDGIDLFGLPFPVHLDVAADGGGAQFVWQNAPVGSYHISARATGPGPYSFDADPIDINVVANHLGRPANDDFADSFDLAQVSTGNNVNATVEPYEPNHNPSAGHSVWWHWTAPSDGWVVFSTAGSSFDTVLVIFSSNNFNLLDRNEISGNQFYATAGATYAILVDGVPGAWGDIQLNVRYGAPPANDDFANSFDLAQITTGNNFNATLEPGEPQIFGLGPSVWWHWTAPSDGWVLISDVGSSFPIYPGIYTGSAIDNLTAVGGSGTPQHQFVRVTAGTTYQIQVVGYGATGVIQLNIHYDVPPTVSLTSPANGDYFDFGTPIHLAATANDADGFLTEVLFEIDVANTQRFPVYSSPYEVDWTPTTHGEHEVVAIAIDNDGWRTRSDDTIPPSIVKIVVGLRVSLTSPANGDSFVVGTPIHLTAIPDDPDGTVSEVGFSIGNSAYYQEFRINSSPYQVDWTPTTPGQYGVMAFVTDIDGGWSGSSWITISVQ